jgi:hypothetical protein
MDYFLEAAVAVLPAPPPPVRSAADVINIFTMCLWLPATAAASGVPPSYTHRDTRADRKTCKPTDRQGQQYQHSACVHTSVVNCKPHHPRVALLHRGCAKLRLHCRYWYSGERTTSAAVTSAPAAISSFTTPECPSWHAASSGVEPSCTTRYGSTAITRSLSNQGMQAVRELK